VDSCANGPKESLVDSRWYLVKEIRISSLVARISFLDGIVSRKGAKTQSEDERKDF